MHAAVYVVLLFRREDRALEHALARERRARISVVRGITSALRPTAKTATTGEEVSAEAKSRRHSACLLLPAMAAQLSKPDGGACFLRAVAQRRLSRRRRCPRHALASTTQQPNPARAGAAVRRRTLAAMQTPFTTRRALCCMGQAKALNNILRVAGLLPTLVRLLREDCGAPVHTAAVGALRQLCGEFGASAAHDAVRCIAAARAAAAQLQAAAT